MPTASLDTLPADILLAIPSVSTPASIRACWQYLIALGICGYAEPLCPRTDLSYAQKKQVLRDHFFQWYGGSSSDAVVRYYELPTGKGRVEASAKGTTVWGPEGATGFMFFRNPSNNRGTGFNQWNFMPGLSDHSVAVDPDQNLLAILDQRCTIHLLTATTQEPHPKAPTPPIAYNPGDAKVFGTTWGGRIELFGLLIIGVFVMGQEPRVSVIFIWNWTTGQELMRLIDSDHRVRHRQTSIFDFLSDNTFVICRQFDPTETLARELPEDTLGLLEIYKFDPLAPSPALHVASLALPASTIKNETVTAVYFSSSLYPPPSLQPQVWGISPETRLICVSINGMRE
ncbi:hypothetical protein FRC09_003003 [Ceratobasidium sp. 395]|nr:hypothetical protein FRC09_003003 [Ceratobasidium sp. 395]